jgi:hypothetical protein
VAVRSLDVLDEGVSLPQFRVCPTVCNSGLTKITCCVCWHVLGHRRRLWSTARVDVDDGMAFDQESA